MKKFNEFLENTNIVVESTFSTDDWKKFNDMAMTGKLKDSDNPIFQFQMIPTKLLNDFISGKYNVLDIMKLELKARK